MSEKSLFSRLYLFFGLFILMTLFFACANEPATPKDLAQENLIPKPVLLTATGSSFKITQKTQIHFDKKNPEIKKVADYLVQVLQAPTGFNTKVVETNKKILDGHISLVLSDENQDLGKEGYELQITEKRIIIFANRIGGLFYGIQTLKQLLPPEIEYNTLQNGPWEIASGTIRDYPDYPYRGAMVDVARHFLDINIIKKTCLLYTSPSPRDLSTSRMPSSA